MMHRLSFFSRQQTLVKPHLTLTSLCPWWCASVRIMEPVCLTRTSREGQGFMRVIACQDLLVINVRLTLTSASPFHAFEVGALMKSILTSVSVTQDMLVASVIQIMMIVVLLPASMEIARTSQAHTDALVILDTLVLIVLMTLMNVSHHPVHLEHATITLINTRVYVMTATQDMTATSRLMNASRVRAFVVHVLTKSTILPVYAQLVLRE